MLEVRMTILLVALSLAKVQITASLCILRYKALADCRARKRAQGLAPCPAGRQGGRETGRQGGRAAVCCFWF